MPESDSENKTRSHIQFQGDIQIEHYRNLERIGAGGLGEVYLAEDTNLGRQAMIAVLPDRCSGNAEREPECRR